MSEIIDLIEVGIPGDTGDVTPDALDAAARAESARDEAVFAAEHSGNLASASASSVPPEQPASVTLSGPLDERNAHFDIPRGLPGVNAVENDEAVATYIDSLETDTRAALLRLLERPGVSIDLIEDFGEKNPKVLRIRSSSTPGTGAGPDAGRSIILQVGDSRAKSMIDYQFPLKPDSLNIWDFRDGEPPESAYRSVAWMGVCHYYDQNQVDHENPTSIHNHISILEMPDANGDLNTIFDSPIHPHDDQTKIGTNLHRIRTNRTDFNFRLGNPYSPEIGRAYRVKLAGRRGDEKMISFHSNDSGETAANNMAGVRWEQGMTGDLETGSNAGSNFAIDYFTDSGFTARRHFLFGDRATGKATFGSRNSGEGRLNIITVGELHDDLYYGNPTSGFTDPERAVFAGHVSSAGSKTFRSMVGGGKPVERFHVTGGGHLVWLNNSGAELNSFKRGPGSTLLLAGNLEWGAAGQGPVVMSSNGNRYRLGVNASGQPIATAL